MNGKGYNRIFAIMEINYAELYGVLPGEKDFNGAINRSLSNGIKHLDGSFLNSLELIKKEREKRDYGTRR